MKTLALVTFLMLGVVASARAVDLGTLEASWPARDTDQLHVDFPMGDLVIRSTDSTTIRAELSVRCRHGGRGCYERSKQLRLVSRRDGGTRHLRLEGMPKFGNHGLEPTLIVEVPKAVAVDLEMGVGDCHIEGLVRDIRVELGVGDVTLGLLERDVRSVRLTVGIGDAALHHGGSAQVVSGFLGRKVRWDEGPGSSHVSVELGIGDIDVRLE